MRFDIVMTTAIKTLACWDVTHTHIHTPMLQRNILSTSSEWLTNEVGSSSEMVGTHTRLHGVIRSFLCSQDPATVRYLETIFSVRSVPVLTLQLIHTVPRSLRFTKVLELLKGTSWMQLSSDQAVDIRTASRAAEHVA